MTEHVPSNMAASVRQRLLNLSQQTGDDYNLLLTRYGTERLLYRLAKSRYADRFVLKGAMLFAVWTGGFYRPTRDLDLLGFGDPLAEHLVAIFRDVCRVAVEEDGLVFDGGTVRCEQIREDQEYQGQRLKVIAMLGTARIDLQVDIGFGDAVTPEARVIRYPTLLNMPAPEIRAYPPEASVAEKLQAMVSLGLANSRMKDFYDVWVILHELEVDDEALAKAVQATFGRRSTPIPAIPPTAFTEEFSSDLAKVAQWQAFVKRADPATSAPTLPQVVSFFRERLWPVIEKARNNTTSNQS